MKHLILIVLISVVSLGNISWKFPVDIRGHITKSISDTAIKISNLLIIVKEGNKIIAKAETDEVGNFAITIPSNVERVFDFFCTGEKIDTFLIGSYTTLKSMTSDLTFSISNTYNYTKSGMVICPKCKKQDKVVALTYFTEVCIVGDTTYATIIGGKRRLGLDYLQIAKFKCRRDVLNF